MARRWWRNKAEREEMRILVLLTLLHCLDRLFLQDFYLYCMSRGSSIFNQETNSHRIKRAVGKKATGC